MIAEWEEHDTWPSPNRNIQWSFACPACEAEYEFYGYILGPYTVRKGDAETHRALVGQLNEARRKVYEVASSRYEQRWVDHVLSRPTKAAMYRAIAPTTSYATFAKHANYEGSVERQARSGFQLHPKECMDRLGIEDAEVNALDSVREDREKGADDFWKNMDKTPVPFS